MSGRCYMLSTFSVLTVFILISRSCQALLNEKTTLCVCVCVCVCTYIVSIFHDKIIVLWVLCSKNKTHLYKNSAKKFCYKNGCIAHGNKTFLHLLDASPLWACQREVYQTLKHFHYSYKSFVGTSFWEHVCKRHLCCPHLLVARDLGCMQIWWHGYTAGYLSLTFY